MRDHRNFFSDGPLLVALQIDLVLCRAHSPVNLGRSAFAPVPAAQTLQSKGRFSPEAVIATNSVSVLDGARLGLCVFI